MHYQFIKKINNYYKERGFIALISVVIISFVLLLVATSLTFTGFFTRFDLLDSEFKKRGEAIADACIESARLVLVQNPDIADFQPYDVSMPSDLIGSPNDFCKIVNYETVIAHSEVNNTQTYYLVKLNISDQEFPRKKFEECANYDLSDPYICQPI